MKEASKGGGNSGSGSGGGAMSMMSESQLAQLKIAAKDVLTSTDNSKLLQEIMKDPQFAGEFAKAIKNDNKQLQKDLMKDPEYQKQMLEIMKNSDYEKMVLEVMKSVPYRQQVMNLIQESMQSPLFKTQLISLMKKQWSSRNSLCSKRLKEEKKKREKAERERTKGKKG
ncbi:spore germination lipoprotein GerD [Paenibacillus larvae]|nr:spore germination lipoprotein GerD [Paenibacillus larvae]